MERERERGREREKERERERERQRERRRPRERRRQRGRERERERERYGERWREGEREGERERERGVTFSKTTVTQSGPPARALTVPRTSTGPAGPEPRPRPSEIKLPARALTARVLTPSRITGSAVPRTRSARWPCAPPSGIRSRVRRPHWRVRGPVPGLPGVSGDRVRGPGCPAGARRGRRGP
jgi:hypothetical protein